MARDDKIEVEGRIKESLPGGQFLVGIISEGFEGFFVRARMSGKMRMNYIRVVPGDRVRLQLPNNINVEEDTITEIGIIAYRFK